MIHPVWCISVLMIIKAAESVDVLTMPTFRCPLIWVHSAYVGTTFSFDGICRFEARSIS